MLSFHEASAQERSLIGKCQELAKEATRNTVIDYETWRVSGVLIYGLGTHHGNIPFFDEAKKAEYVCSVEGNIIQLQGYYLEDGTFYSSFDRSRLFRLK